MEIESWKSNLLSYVDKLEEISNKKLLNIILKDEILKNCVIDFFQPISLNDIIILYDEYLWVFKSNIGRWTIPTQALEGVPINLIEWDTVSRNLPSNSKIQFCYLIFEDSLDPLYELKLICEQYGITYNPKNITIKCLIDNRSSLYKKSQILSIESRAGIIVNSVI